MDRDRSMPPERFIPEIGDADLAREKARARALRQSAWWKRRQVGARALTADHVIPLIRGGRSIRANLVPCCKDCNSKKQSLLPWQWDDFVGGFAED